MIGLDYEKNFYFFPSRAKKWFIFYIGVVSAGCAAWAGLKRYPIT